MMMWRKNKGDNNFRNDFCFCYLVSKAFEAPWTIFLVLWWVDLRWLPDAHPAALPLLNETGAENAMEKLVVQDKDWEITYQLSSRAKET